MVANADLKQVDKAVEKIKKVEEELVKVEVTTKTAEILGKP